jgi:hypothetical protein
MLTMKYPIQRCSSCGLLRSMTLLLCAALVVSGCFREKTKYKGDGCILKIPPSWKLARKDDTTDKLFMNVSEFGSSVATFNGPEKNAKTGRPKARVSLFSQKFTQPLWVEDITADIINWVKRQGYTILGSGKVNYQGSVGFSVNYRDEETGLIYLEFYFASDNRVYIVLSMETTPEDFSFYLPDYEKFRNNIEFPLIAF